MWETIKNNKWSSFWIVIYLMSILLTGINLILTLAGKEIELFSYIIYGVGFILLGVGMIIGERIKILEKEIERLTKEIENT